MSQRTLALACLLIGVPACNGQPIDRTGPEATIVRCDTVAAPPPASVRILQAGWPAGAVAAAAAAVRPDTEGALGRNQVGYFHVRFQMGMAALADAGRVEEALRAMSYGFSRTTADGDFPLVIPAGLSGTPTAADMASARAFFLSDAGAAAHALLDTMLPSHEADQLAALAPAARRALDRLLADSLLLAAGDARAPNRLLFDALAYVSLGRWLEDARAVQAGRGFVAAALALQAPTGWFREGDGWDSSYQAVALARGWRVWALLPMGGTRDSLGRALHCGTAWLASRIDGSGTISTVGNTRVFDGGESFLGTPKAMAWADAVRALFDAGRATRDPTFTTIGSRVWARHR
ncbi:MAG: hypothetical protein SFW08_08095 [Gemmatimonadaceae bacterium]|nr:hypothetical protein [Gemmatimonadaceae bacterium]